MGQADISDKKHSLRAKVDPATFTAQIRDAMDEARKQAFFLHKLSSIGLMYTYTHSIHRIYIYRHTYYMQMYIYNTHTHIYTYIHIQPYEWHGMFEGISD